VVRHSLDWPRVVLGALAVVTLAGLVIAASTSSAAFGPYNYDWDGTTELRAQANAVGTEPTVLRGVSRYGSAPPDETVAVILSPKREYTVAESTRIRRFLDRGGTLVVADDSGSTVNSLLASVGTSARIDGATVRDERNNYRSSGLPVADGVSNDSLVADVPELVINYGSAVQPGEATVLVNTSEYAYLDRNGNGEVDAEESLDRRPIATVERVGAGQVVVVSDASVFINAMLERPGNRAFVRNLFSLGDHVLLDYSHGASLPPLALAVLLVRDSVPAQIGMGLAGLALVGTWSRVRPVARLRGRLADAPDPDPTPVSTDDVVAAVERRHPEWDDDRIRRVARRLRPEAKSSERGTDPSALDGLERK
jgi:hypothetical protein